MTSFMERICAISAVRSSTSSVQDVWMEFFATSEKPSRGADSMAFKRGSER